MRRSMRRFPRSALSLLTLLALTAAEGGVASASGVEKLWLEIEDPHDNALVREPYPLVEIRGWAGTGIRGRTETVTRRSIEVSSPM